MPAPKNPAYELNDTVREILKDNVPISRLAQDILQLRNLKKVGKHYTALCPFHEERTPSFQLVDDKQFYHCFGCGKHGDIFTLIMQQKELSFPQAMRALASKYLPNNARVKQYLLRTSSQERDAETSAAYNNLEDTLEMGDSNRQYFDTGDFETGDFDIEEASHSKRRPRSTYPTLLQPDQIPFDLSAPNIEELLHLLDYAQTYFVEQLRTNNHHNAQRAREYLASRKFNTALIEEIKIGYAPPNDILLEHLVREMKKQGTLDMRLLQQCGLISPQGHAVFSNRITFPINTAANAPTGFIARALNGDERKMKYKNSPQCTTFSKSHMLIGLEHLTKEHVRRHGLYIVEGATDLAGFLTQEMRCALALGSTRITEKHVGLIRELSPEIVYLVTDGDAAGIAGAISNANRLLGTLDDQAVQIVPLPEEKDPFDLFHIDERDIKAHTINNAMTPKQFLYTNIEILLKRYLQPEDAESFLAHHTSHIASQDELDRHGIQLPKQRASSFTTETPHELILKGLR